MNTKLREAVLNKYNLVLAVLLATEMLIFLAIASFDIEIDGGITINYNTAPYLNEADVCKYHIKDVEVPSHIFKNDTLLVKVVLEQVVDTQKLFRGVHIKRHFGGSKRIELLKDTACSVRFEIQDNSFSFNGDQTKTITLADRITNTSSQRHLELYLQTEKAGSKYLVLKLTSPELETPSNKIMISALLRDSQDHYLATISRPIEVYDNALGIPASLQELITLTISILGAVSFTAFGWIFFRLKKAYERLRVAD